MTPKKTPQNYFEAQTMLRKRNSIRVCNNTCLRKFAQTPGTISLILYNTAVVIYTPNSLILNTGGCDTKLTRSRINSALPNRWLIQRRRGISFICCNFMQFIFHNGFTLSKLSDGSWFPTEELKKPEVVGRIIKQKCFN